MEEYNKQHLPTRLRCWSCNESVTIPDTAEYGDTFSCPCGKKEVIIVKPPRIQILQPIRSSVDCDECEITLTSDEPIAISCPCKHISVLFHDKIELDIEDDKIFFNRIRAIKLGDGKLSLDHLSYGGINEKLDYFITLFSRALKLNTEVTSNLGRQGTYNIRPYGEIMFSVDNRTLSLSDGPSDITLVFDENLVPRITELNGYYDNVLYTYLNHFCALVKDKINDIEPIASAEELLGYKWRDIPINSLSDISEVKGEVIIGRYGYPVTPRTNWRYWYERIRHEHGYINDVWVDQNSSNIDFIFAYQHDTSENYDLFEHIILSENRDQHLADLVETKTRTTNMSPSDRRTTRKRTVSRIRAEGADKCIKCGGLIHSIQSYKGFKDQDVLINSKGQLGSLCCSCYGEYRGKLEYAEEMNKEILEEREEAKAS